MSTWFEGSVEIACSLPTLKQAMDDLGEHYRDVVALMPGLTRVELVEQGPKFVTIRTNEGLMKRTNISKRIEGDRVVVEFDEEYQAGSRVTTTSHFLDTFSTNASGLTFHTVMSGVQAPGFLGFLYRTFGSSSMGKAFLGAYKTHLESLPA